MKKSFKSGGSSSRPASPRPSSSSGFKPMKSSSPKPSKSVFNKPSKTDFDNSPAYSTVSKTPKQSTFFPNQPGTRRRRSTPLIILLVVVLCCLVLACVGVVYLFTQGLISLPSIQW